MNEDNYIEMIKKLREKTDSRETIWQRGQRDEEFSITFKSGMFVIDKNYDYHEEVTNYNFQIYNNNSDQIYTTGSIGSSNRDLYIVLKTLHDSVVRCYYKVDETMKGFLEEMDGEEIVGEEPSKRDPTELPGDDIPF